MTNNFEGVQSLLNALTETVRSQLDNAYDLFGWIRKEVDGSPLRPTIPDSRYQAVISALSLTQLAAGLALHDLDKFSELVKEFDTTDHLEEGKSE